MAHPIWKDYYYEFEEDEVSFRIKTNDTDGEVIYTGKAFARPNSTGVKIRVNDICADYIEQALPVWGKEFNEYAYTKTFLLEYDDEGTWTPDSTVTFYNDWSYDYEYLASRDGFSFPINDLLDARQFLVFSLETDDPSINVTVSFLDGTSITKIVTVHRTADFNDDFNEDFAIFEMSASEGTVVIDLSKLANVASIEIEGVTFPVDNSLCNTHAIYYVNAYGGWDSLLLKGRASQKDNYVRHTMKVGYDNTTIEGRGTVNYANEVQKTFTLQSGWISELGASRMHHLLGSTMVYLQDLATGEMMPVIITNSECEYKTHAGEGNKLINYTIEASLAQERVRR